MFEQVLLLLGAAIFGFLGGVHLLYTFFTPKFEPRDPALTAAMKAISPKLTSQTTMWLGWVGFNASHSLGAICFAIFLGLMAAGHMALMRQAPEFAWLATVNGLAWLLLAKRYWFRIPLVGISIATVCFLVAAVRLSF